MPDARDEAEGEEECQQAELDAWLQKLREAGLSAWDDIEDPEGFIRELRGEEESP